MNAQDYLEYYKRQESEATRQMVAQLGVGSLAAEECLEYFRRVRMHWQAVVSDGKP